MSAHHKTIPAVNAQLFHSSFFGPVSQDPIAWSQIDLDSSVLLSFVPLVSIPDID